MAEVVDVLDRIEEIETVWIPLADGRRLAARLFLPRERPEPVPVVLEYIPYRRRDGTRLGDEAMHRWFAAEGIAAARVDIAGTGDSDGLMDDEYVQREQDDGLEVIAWLAAQPWCSGAVGIIGISWGGFNGLQIAARRPPALKAIITVCSTVDRYHGDVHYTGGCLNEENLEWGACLFTMNAFPPDPAIVGEDRWRDLWRERIDNARLAPADWLEHQRRDEFWKHGSVIEDLSAIEAPVLALSGWVDGYTGVVFDLLEGLSSPCAGIVGPWGHKYPNHGVPGPAIGFLQEAKRWWDHWLVADEPGASVVGRIPAEGSLRVWLQTSHEPLSHIDERPGRWVGFDHWATATGPAEVFHLSAAGGLVRDGDGGFAGAARGAVGDQPALQQPTPAGSAVVSSPVTTGLAGGQWCAYGQGKISPELATDQRVDDLGSLVYDSEVLAEPLTSVGRPEMKLRLISDQPVAQVAVRLSDVHPDGTVERLSYGVLNLCHRDSHAEPTVVPVGKAIEVVVPMKALAHTVPAGHRLRVAISTGYWPMIWPAPHQVTLTVLAAGSSLRLPTPPFIELADGGFEPPVAARYGGVTESREGHERRQVVRDLGERITEFIASRDDGTYVLDDIGTELSFTRVRRTTITDDQPLSAAAETYSTATFRRGGWDVAVESRVRVTCDAEHFYVTACLTAHDAGRLFAERRFDRTIHRDHI